MKFKTWTVGIAVLALTSAPVFAEDSLGQWSFDEQVTPVGCCDSGCDDCGCGSSACCGGRGLLSGMGSGWLEGMSLSSALGLDCSRIDVGGWTQFGYHDSPTPLATGSFNNVPKELNLHQQWFYLGREADGSNGLDFGFRADFVYGTDAQKTQSFNNPGATVPKGGTFDAGFDHGVYGWAIPQLYVEVAKGDLAVKIGHFFTIAGYEVIPATGNFFYSHSLAMFNAEPFTHTGVLATYTGYENMTLFSGWSVGWDTGFDQFNGGGPSHGNNLIGGFSADLHDWVTMTYVNTYGDLGAISTTGDEDHSHSLVFDVTLTDNLNYVWQTDYLSIDEAVGVRETVGINQYLFYAYNDIVTFGNRIEWLRVDGLSNYEFTSGVNIQLLDNLVLRPEARKDWVPATGFDQDMFGADMILTY